jgi:Zn-dependent protease
MQGFLAWNVCLARIAGVHVRLHLFFGLAVVLAAWALRHEPATTWWWAAAFLGVLTGSVLVHELAHCLAARRHGGSPHEVVLWPLGGLVQISVPRSPGNERAVAFAGPMANFLLAAAGSVVLYSRGAPAIDGAGAPEMESGIGIELFSPPMDPDGLTMLGVVRLATWINFYLGCLNLLPAVPMDGARLVRSVLWSLIGYRRAVRYTQGLTLAAAAAVCVTPVLLQARGVRVDLLVELSLVLLGVFLLIAVQGDARRRPAQEDDEPREPDEWRVGHAEPLLAGDESSGAAAMIGQAVETRLEERLQRQQQQEAEEDRRVDEILSRLHVAGPDALSPEDQAFLHRVSARYRGRKSK